MAGEDEVAPADAPTVEAEGAVEEGGSVGLGEKGGAGGRGLETEDQMVDGDD